MAPFRRRSSASLSRRNVSRVAYPPAQASAQRTGTPATRWGNLRLGLCAKTCRSRSNRTPNIQDAKHFTGSVNIAYQPVTQVSLDATLGVDVVNQVSTDFAPFGYNVDNFISFDPDGYKFLDDRTRREITAEAKATWSTKLGDDFQSTLVGGGQGFVAKVEDVGEGGEHFPGPGLEIVGAGSSPSIYERFLSTVNAGVFAQDQLAYRDWAFLTLGGRYDRNSAFGKTTQGVFYPKASIAVQPSSLSSWSSSALRSHLSTLRVRAAIGASGLQPGAFDKFTTFSPLTSELGPGLV